MRILGWSLLADWDQIWNSALRGALIGGLVGLVIGIVLWLRRRGKGGNDPSS